jgi:hypothetical protein
MCYVYPLLVHFLQTHISLPRYCDIIPMYCKADFHLKFHIRNHETGIATKVIALKIGNLEVY